MSSNPSHILIARNSRGSNNPSAALSSPTETHAAAAGIFRSSGSPPWLLEECETDDIVSELSIDDDVQAIELDETFTKNSPFPGSVKIVVESTTFWCVYHLFCPTCLFNFLAYRAHKEVLFFASPFFEAALSGNWAETGRPPSMSSVITISQPPSVPDGSGSRNEATTEMTFAPVESDADAEREDTETLIEGIKDHSGTSCSSSGHDSAASTSPMTLTSDPTSSEKKQHARAASLAKLQSPLPPGAHHEKKDPGKRRPRTGPDAVIVLKEERVRHLLKC